VCKRTRHRRVRGACVRPLRRKFVGSLFAVDPLVPKRETPGLVRIGQAFARSGFLKVRPTEVA
jgi:hypothetical protein